MVLEWIFKWGINMHNEAIVIYEDSKFKYDLKNLVAKWLSLLNGQHKRANDFKEPKLKFKNRFGPIVGMCL